MFPIKLFCLLLAVSTIAPIQAVDYYVTNNATGTPGGAIFDFEMGIPRSKRTLRHATEFIWKTFKQDEGNRVNWDEVTMEVVEGLSGVSSSRLSTIYLSSDYIANFNGSVRKEIIGILYHESTHIWQYNGQGLAPSGLINGIADYIRLKAGWAPSHWQKRGSGDKWDEGYEVTAYFLEYCNKLLHGFVAELNALMKYDYSDDFFEQILGDTVDNLWSDYKDVYGNY